MNDTVLRAAGGDDLHRVQWLLREDKASITAVDDQGRSALQIAAMNGQIAMLQWLLSEGDAKISERSQSGTSALLYTAINEEITCRLCLFEFGGAAQASWRHQIAASLCGIGSRPNYV
jgi:ankyrin repeat protein